MKSTEFKRILASFLHENSLSQTDFAKEVGVKPSQVSEWLKGKAKPGYDTLRSICTAYKTSADFWLDLE